VRFSVRDLPTPTAPKLKRNKAHRADAERLIASPSALPASGGALRLRARVRNAMRCRFSAAGALSRLPSTRSCASGRASVTVWLPRNNSSAARSYTLYLTAIDAHGRRRTVRDVVRERSTAVTGSGVTAASSFATQSAGSDELTSASSPPVITTQPTDQSVVVNAPVTLAALATGNPTPSVQWQVSADGGASWANSGSSFVAGVGENGHQYRAVFANVAGTATTGVVTLTVLPRASTNFSGYVTYAEPGQSFTAVSASWIVPSVTCQPGQTSWAAQWPGIGDDTSVEQDGTETDCFGGSPTYWAWYEMYGDPAVNNGYAVPLPGSSYPVLPGDQMSGSVSISNSTWQLSLADSTQNWTFQTSIASPTPGLSQSSAEWMVEDPDGCTPQCQTLAQFSPVQFSSAAAALDGQSQSSPISSFPLTSLQIDQNSTLLSTPGALSVAGDGFTDTWLAS